MAEVKKCVITDAAGFIGANLTQALLNEGWQVVGFDNFSTGRIENLNNVQHNPGFTFVEGDIRDHVALAKVMAGAKVVFHQAALGSLPRPVEDPWTTYDCNVDGTLQTLLAAKE